MSLGDRLNGRDQSENVADKNPEKLKELENPFWIEAKKYNVVLFDASVASQLIGPRSRTHCGPQLFTLTQPLTGTSNGDAPSILNASYNFKADVVIPQEGGDGMLITQGGRFGGYGSYVLKGKPLFTRNLADLKRVRWEADNALSLGKHTLEFDF